MGILSWFFPSPADRIATAKKHLAAERWAEARLEVLDLEEPEAKEVCETAEIELAKVNLKHAVSWAHAGDNHRVAIHLELAEEFGKSKIPDEFRAARKELRELREAARAVAAEEKAAAERRLLENQTRGPISEGWISAPDDVSEEERDAVEARLGLLVEGYPENLRARVTELGPEFVRAVLHLDEGRPDLAVPTLLALPSDEPLVLWERGRAMHAGGQSEAAVESLRAFGESAGHQSMGTQHSAVLMAQCLLAQQKVVEALDVLTKARRKEPKLAGFMVAQLQFATGDLASSERVLTGLIKEHPRTPQFYTMLARVRVAGDHRMEAMSALETSLNTVVCTPGRCGSQPPDLETHRMLATLYLEDGIETDRALELAQKATELVRKPAWEDQYLRALVAKRSGDPSVGGLVRQLEGAVGNGDPRRKLLADHLA